MDKLQKFLRNKSAKGIGTILFVSEAKTNLVLFRLNDNKTLEDLWSGLPSYISKFSVSVNLDVVLFVEKGK